MVIFNSYVKLPEGNWHVQFVVENHPPGSSILGPLTWSICSTPPAWPTKEMDHTVSHIICACAAMPIWITSCEKIMLSSRNRNRKQGEGRAFVFGPSWCGCPECWDDYPDLSVCWESPFFWPQHFPSVEKQAKMYCKCKKLQNKQNQIGHAAIVDRRGRGRSDVRFNLRCAWKDLQRPTHPGNGRTDFLKLWNLVRWCVLSLEWTRVKIIPLPRPCQISTRASGILKLPQLARNRKLFQFMASQIRYFTLTVLN